MEEIRVETPSGVIKVSAKGAYNEYPGVFVDFEPRDGLEVALATIEYNTSDGMVKVIAFGDADSEEATDIIAVEGI